MATAQLDRLMGRLRQAALVGDGGGLSDGQLLELFISRRDEAAFAALVRKHGPMVLGVCRRLLRDPHDADDAFQATFLVLVRKAATLAKKELVGNWLYGTAYRAALEARTASMRRRIKERQAGAMPKQQSINGARDPEWRAVLDQEIMRLPEKYRVPLVLCELESLRRKEAAQKLGIPEGTLSSRLATARKLLAKRLARHGLPGAGGAMTGILSSNVASASVPASLVASTAAAAGKFMAGGGAAAVSSNVAALVQGVIQAMFLSKLQKMAGLALLAVLVLSTVFISDVLSAKPAEGAQAGVVKPNPAKPPQTDAAKAGRIYLHRDFNLMTVQSDGAKAAYLANPSDADLYGYQIHTARLSPDGKRMAFGKSVIKQVDGGVESYPPDRLFLRDVDNSKAATPLVAIDGVEIHHLAWSPDSAKLAFTSWDKENGSRSWIVDVKTKKHQEIKLPRYKHNGKEYGMSVQAWSPDGKSFLTYGNGLHLVKTDGTGARRITKERKGILGGSCRFSPDGKKVLFVVVHQKENMTLHVVDVADGKERAVVDALNFTSLHACFSPDSRRIAYTVTPLDDAGKRLGETTLFVADADGGNTTALMTEKHDPGAIHLLLVDWR